jgi:ankyrin repeat protein
MKRNRSPRPPPKGGGSGQPSREQVCLKAVQQGRLERACALLQEGGVAANWQDDNGYSLFFHAIFRRHFQIAEALLAHGANIDLPDRHGWTPLFWAAFNGHADVVEFLAAHGADADAATCEGDRPLFMAACKGHTAVVRLLLTAGARPDAADASGHDAFWVACIMHHEDIMKLLEAHSSNGAARLDAHQPSPDARHGH